MNFDVYFPFKTRKGIWCPGVEAKPMSWKQILSICQQPEVNQRAAEFQAGNAEAKKRLPAICWVGRATKGKRLAEEMEPTQLVMIDVDHVDDAKSKAYALLDKINKREELAKSLLVIHITPSGKGIRLVFRATQNYESLSEHMKYYNELLKLSELGDFDPAVKDLGRLSFLVPYDYFVYSKADVSEWVEIFKERPIKNSGESIKEPSEGELFDHSEVPNFTEEEIENFEHIDYRGTPIKIIVEKYIEVKGQPSSGEIHNFYNELVKNFRCITSNDKRLLLYVLPRFGHTADECWSQIKSICRVNTLSRLPKDFYFFLKDNGFYVPKGQSNDSMREYMMSEDGEETILPPYLPPVFRELLGTAPKDFVIPCMNALLPILGTLTSYLRAVYPYDRRVHSTSFFSVIYAPPSTGKGFVDRFIDLLFTDLRLRDYVQSCRENVYLRAMNKKSQTEKSPDMPHTSLRIIPTKNSEAEFLQKQQDNQGYHMFTYAAEMDSWAKGVKAAGGNKDDMVRIAWDNGEYGQQFKSFNTFKGMVHLYWNVLILGTLDQVERYFKNVENGLVTRCSFTSIENQEFAPPPVWGNISKRGMAVIKAFTDRCDRRTYLTPCSINPLDLEVVNDDDFDKEIDWKFKFAPKKEVDLSWIMPTIDNFHKEQMKLAARDIDRARDVFRRRVGVRGFRLALLCEGLWENPRPSDREKCCQFVDWWMHRDIEGMMSLWGARYNEQTETSPMKVQRTVFDALPAEFTRADVYTVCMKQGIKSPVRRIIFDWKKLGYINEVSKQLFKKKSS